MTKAAGKQNSPSSQPKDLERGLSPRHLQLISIGGAVGTGLFMGSGQSINIAGPSLLIIYMIIGFFLFLMLRAMGELLLSNLNYASFKDFASDLLGPAVGYFVGWSYWFTWIVVSISDVIAISDYLDSLFGRQGNWLSYAWIPSLTLIILLLGLNLLSVRGFGETEFWFSIIKVATIIIFIVVGLVMVLFAFTPQETGIAASFSNIWEYDGIFPHGITGFIGGFQLAVFSFAGIELIGTAAAETKDPHKNLPKAINTVPVRIMLFYVLSILVIISIIPWTYFKPDAQNNYESPFILIFKFAGLGIAATVITLVVISSAASSSNSGIYSTSRMLYGLAKRGEAPQFLGTLNAHKIPAAALLFSGLFLLISIPILYAGESASTAFQFITTIGMLMFLFTWIIICISYIAYRYRRPWAHTQSKYKVPGGQVSVYAALVFFAFAIVSLIPNEETRFALFLTPLWFLLLGVTFFFVRRSSHYKIQVEDYEKRKTEDRVEKEKYLAAT